MKRISKAIQQQIDESMRDPSMRAFRRVQGFKSLNSTERMSLLTAWEFYRSEGRSIDGAYLAFIMNVPEQKGESILGKLRSHGLIDAKGQVTIDLAAPCPANVGDRT